MKEEEVRGTREEDFSRGDGISPYEHRAKYYETDQMGIIHHSNYLRWMEEARIDWLSQIGWPYKKLEEMGIFIPVLSVSVQYLSMVHFDETAVLHLTLTRYNGIRLCVRYRIIKKETNEMAATAESSHCFLNREGKPLSLRRSFPEVDAGFLAHYHVDGADK